jgi:hypothetical protein
MRALLLLQELQKYRAGSSSSSSMPNFYMRRYDPCEIVQIIRYALNYFEETEELRIVSFGSEDGYWLDTVKKYVDDSVTKQIHFIGIEGGSLVGACRTLISNFQEKYDANNYIGLKAECKFEDAIQNNHPIVSHKNHLPTIGHVYDGGILRKDVVAQLIVVANTFAPRSIMIFVTSWEKNIDNDDPLADKSFINSHMKRGNWKLLEKGKYIGDRFWRISELEDRGGVSSEKTMQVLVYQKLEETPRNEKRKERS